MKTFCASSLGIIMMLAASNVLAVERPCPGVTARFEQIAPLDGSRWGVFSVRNGGATALKAALIREMAGGFGADARAALGEGVMAVVTSSLELLGTGEIPFQPESRWDVELDGKFGGLPGRLQDYASAAYAPSVLLQEVAGAIRRLQFGPLDVARLADWWAGAARHLSTYVDPRSLAIHLDELGGLDGGP